MQPKRSYASSLPLVSDPLPLRANRPIVTSFADTREQRRTLTNVNPPGAAPTAPRLAWGARLDTWVDRIDALGTPAAPG